MLSFLLQSSSFLLKDIFYIFAKPYQSSNRIVFSLSNVLLLIILYIMRHLGLVINAKKKSDSMRQEARYGSGKEQNDLACLIFIYFCCCTVYLFMNSKRCFIVSVHLTSFSDLDILNTNSSQ